MDNKAKTIVGQMLKGLGVGTCPGPGQLSNQIVFNYLLSDALFTIKNYLVNFIIAIIGASHWKTIIR